MGVNIILGQLANFTGYAAEGANRVIRAFNTLVHPGELQWATVAVGAATIVLIIVLERTRIGPMGLVVAVIVTSAAAAALGWEGVATLSDLGVVPSSLPLPQAPMLGLVPSLLIPAVSLAFVGLVQGASISATYPNPDGRYPDMSRDFSGQGIANISSGIFQGMPVGGSVSASALNKVAGARSRQSLIFAGIVMAVVIVAFGGVVGYIAMPALAGLLMLIGYRTINVANLRSVWRTGLVQKVVLAATFALTMIVPLQYAVLIGVALSVVLHVVRQSNQVVVKRQVHEGGHVAEIDPPATLPANEVVVLQPYGSLFFAAAPVFEGLLPVVEATSRNSVVILRLRGRSELGSTVMGILHRYAGSLTEVRSRLVIVSTNERIDGQLAASGVSDLVGPEWIYRGDERVGAALERAESDAAAWVAANRRGDGDEPDRDVPP